MVDDSQCPICQAPKKASTEGSLTQWIISCSCNDAVVEAQSRSAKICTICAKPIREGRPGSFTQFIFQSDVCTCKAPAQVRAGLAEVPVNRDFQGVCEARVEEELNIGQNAFPLDRYKPLQSLGEGRFGSVYLARDRLLDKIVAVKTLHALTAKELMSFQQEAKTLSKLSHESIVTVLDFGIVNSEVPYMVLDYVAGSTLRDVLDNNGAFAWETARDVFEQICEGLNHAHKNGVLHRDLNPDNVLLINRDDHLGVENRSERFDVRIIDFGIAELLGSKNDGPTNQSALAGTPFYMSPDAGNGRPYDLRSEVYSVGCMLFEALSGHPPFMGNSPLETLRMHALNRLPDLSEVVDGDVPVGLQPVLDKALAKDPDDRFKSMPEFKAALENVGTGYDFVDKETRSPVVAKPASYSVPLMVTSSIVAFLILCPLVYSLVAQEQPFRKAKNTKSNDPSNNSSTRKKVRETQIAGSEQKDDVTDLVDESVMQKWQRDQHDPSKVKAFEITDDDFKTLANGTPITQLQIAESTANGVGFKYIANQPLVTLEIKMSPLTDDGAYEISKIKTITRLYIENADGLTRKGISFIASLPRLNHLLLRYSRLPEDTFTVLSSSETMYILDVSHSQPIRVDDLRSLANAPKLSVLKLGDTDINDSHAAALEATKLSSLFVNDTQITDQALLSLAKIKTLSVLTILPAEKITREGLKRFKKALPGCNIDSDN